ncbi:MAG: nucleotide sugar dehydrogenase [Candidatus Nomurabacteria bacterium]|nr:MAG: nucleotide sugar dehydrogenase [Candidatus Nomurabacteria bacterium]
MSSVKSIAVIGLGYVGLPLTLLAANKGFRTYGIEIDARKLSSLKDGKSYVDDISDSDITDSKVDFTDNIAAVSKVDAVIICVPTPVDENRQPDLGIVKSAVSSIAPHLKKGTLVVVESTINPGVCDEIVVPLLEEKSGKKVGTDIYLAHCPERINPGDKTWSVRNINRVVGANSKVELEKAVELYSGLIDAEIKPMGSLKEAEAVKIVENSFRDINIAFVNELAMSFHKLGINLENVIDGAATKPFAFMAHRPGCGVGGHCIPVDPYYLIEYAHTHGFDHSFLRLARNINESMPQFTVDLLTESLDRLELPVKGTKVALLGLSYKSNVGDSRESPAKVIRALLEDAGVKLSVYDPYIDDSTAKTLSSALKGAKAIVIATGHDEFKAISVNKLKAAGVQAVIDGRNIFRSHISEFVKYNIIYEGVGVSSTDSRPLEQQLSSTDAIKVNNSNDLRPTTGAKENI